MTASRGPAAMIALLALAAAALLPAVGAQQAPPGGFKPTLLELQSPRGLYLPDAQVATVNVTLKIDCLLAASDTPINFTVTKKPAWLFIRSLPGWHTEKGNFTGYYSSDKCDDSTRYVTIREKMVANFTTYAPAYRFANFTIVASRSNVVVTADGAIQPGYYATLEVVPPAQVTRVGAQDTKVDVPFRVRNLGNGATTVRVDVTAPTGVRADFPEVMKLGADAQGSEWDKPLPVRLFLDEVKDDFTITVKVTGFSQNGTNPIAATGSEASQTVDFQRPLAPAPGVVAGVLAVAAAVLLLRRR